MAPHVAPLVSLAVPPITSTVSIGDGALRKTLAEFLGTYYPALSTTEVVSTQTIHSSFINNSLLYRRAADSLFDGTEFVSMQVKVYSIGMMTTGIRTIFSPKVSELHVPNITIKVNNRIVSIIDNDNIHFYSGVAETTLPHLIHNMLLVSVYSAERTYDDGITTSITLDLDNCELITLLFTHVAHHDNAPAITINESQYMSRMRTLDQFAAVPVELTYKISQRYDQRVGCRMFIYGIYEMEDNKLIRDGIGRTEVQYDNIDPRELIGNMCAIAGMFGIKCLVPMTKTRRGILRKQFNKQFDEQFSEHSPEQFGGHIPEQFDEQFGEHAPEQFSEQFDEQFGE
jgi:hypothetical protein